jgi:cell division protein FtsL
LIARTRLLLLVALVVGIAIIATEFPFRQLLDERASVTQSSQQLRQLDQANRSLQSQVKSLSQASAIEGLAHSQYGLVQAGQRSVIVLPGGGTGTTGPLASNGIPKSDIVPSDSIVSTPGGGNLSENSSSFWGRVLQRLEFWKVAQ